MIIFDLFWFLFPSEIKENRLKTVKSTQQYVALQRRRLFLLILYNIMFPYWSCVVPLFVIAGANAGNLEQYFVLTLFVLSHFFWSFLLHTPQTYSDDIYNGNTMCNSRHRQNVLNNNNDDVDLDWDDDRRINRDQVQALERDGERKSTPSVMRVICLCECWKELFLCKLISCGLLLGYGVALLGTYVITILGGSGTDEERNSLKQHVQVGAIVVMYAMFFVSLIKLFRYNGPFFKELVTRDKGMSDWDVLLRVFSMRFPDDLFPVHLSASDSFRSSADLFLRLKTLANTTMFYGTVENAMNHRLNDDTNTWKLLTESNLSADTQLHFLQMLHYYLTEGMSLQVGQFLSIELDESHILANIQATVDEFSTAKGSLCIRYTYVLYTICCFVWKYSCGLFLLRRVPDVNVSVDIAPTIPNPTFEIENPLST
jgi:hypothetical protein